MRSPSAAFFAKELRELASARAFVLVAAAIGPLVALAYRDALVAFADASGGPGSTGALASALSPLDGIVAPILGAYAVAATLLFPFVAIRVGAADRESGAQWLVLQSSLSTLRVALLQFAALIVAWLALLVPGLVALGAWASVGGHLHAGETLGVLLGHVWHGAFIAALGLACAALTESAASAAVVALAVTLGAWALDFTAAVRGGFAATLAAYTPDAVLRTFEHGLVASNVMLVTALAIATLIGVASLWSEPTRPRGRALLLALGVTAVAVLLGIGAGGVRTTRDVSEDQRNSFASADEAALGTINDSLEIDVHLAPSDPRRADLERDVLAKLRRSMPHVRVREFGGAGSGLFAAAGSGYGEVWYALRGRRILNRSSTPEIVLETVYELAGVPVPPRAPSAYPGYPARIVPSWTVLIVLAVVWPLAVLVPWGWRRRAWTR